MIQMKKLNNKGFSLVELIIVIAIMAILVGVVGTQVIPYLENSRKAKDNQILSGWNTAGVSAYSTEAANLSSTETYTITVQKSGTTCSTGTGSANLLKTFCALTDLVNETTGATKGYDFEAEMSSKAGKDISKVEIVINGLNGQVETKTTNANPGKFSFDVIENK
jgi:prepilin-type N-terminal cleavage/methylation domain-containing protein